jgi:hypothetical protein
VRKVMSQCPRSSEEDTGKAWGEDEGYGSLPEFATWFVSGSQHPYGNGALRRLGATEGGIVEAQLRFG